LTEILTGLHGDRRDDWFAALDADDQPDLHSFAYGIKRDQQAVLNRLRAQSRFHLGSWSDDEKRSTSVCFGTEVGWCWGQFMRP
jgi:hypothetical protein